ncbi:MAG TPA: phospho-N-acetylmuramoyl-pentapeptide-transferase [Dehalococcoidia bacterium]|nr:phospho-N-acetylmuramoyl-pentapeptide-transferase [Dehalococcoidia bacterium]
MTRALVSGVVALIIAILLGGPVVRQLEARKLGKAISEYLPSSHQIKAGVPTMGGLIIFLTVLLVTVPFNLAGRWSILLPFAMIGATGLIGFVDDLGSLQGRARAGLSWRLKFGLVALLALVAGFVLYFPLKVHRVAVPYYGHLDLGWGIVPLAVLIIVLTTSAVAVTDGLDMLAGGTSVFAFAAYGIVAAVQGQPFLGAFCFTVVGATLGFIYHNAYPARVIMGDTGALALGSSLAVVALMTEQWLVLPIIGVVFVVEAASDVLQIGYFKYSHGKRILRKAPLHHHFEMGGWSEVQVVIRFWLAGIAGAMIGVALAIKVS